MGEVRVEAGPPQVGASEVPSAARSGLRPQVPVPPSGVRVRLRVRSARGGPQEARGGPQEARGGPQEARGGPQEARGGPQEARGGPQVRPGERSRQPGRQGWDGAVAPAKAARRRGGS